jgi:predicted component of viral defense system (DUF524 family)
MAEDLKDAIISISKGKSTRNKIGSRQVPHRLRQEERLTVSRAIQNGFIETYPWSRVNASNIYEKMCHSLNLRPVFCLHEEQKSIVWYKTKYTGEVPPKELVKDSDIYQINENIVDIFLSDRKVAKSLAKALSEYLNS